MVLRKLSGNILCIFRLGFHWVKYRLSKFNGDTIYQKNISRRAINSEWRQNIPNNRNYAKLFSNIPNFKKLSKPKFPVQPLPKYPKVEGFGIFLSKLAALVQASGLPKAKWQMPLAFRLQLFWPYGCPFPDVTHSTRGNVWKTYLLGVLAFVAELVWCNACSSTVLARHSDVLVHWRHHARRRKRLRDSMLRTRLCNVCHCSASWALFCLEIVLVNFTRISLAEI